MNEIIDVNTWLGAWPFQFFECDTAAKLAGTLSNEGITRAMVSSSEAVFNNDYVRANEILLERISSEPMLEPAIVIDPSIPGFERHLEETYEQGARVVRVIPSYHGYSLSDPRCASLVDQITETGDMTLMVQVRMEDERTHHPRVQVPAIGIDDIIAFANDHSNTALIVLGLYYQEAREVLTTTGNARVDISFVETFHTIASLESDVPVGRILLGSHSPFLAARSAILKLLAPHVSDETRQAIASENFQSLRRR